MPRDVRMYLFDIQKSIGQLMLFTADKTLERNEN